MAIAKITGAGLVTIAVLTGCLWACILTENRITKDAQRRETIELIHLRKLRDGKRLVPASMPGRGDAVSRAVTG